MAKARMTAKRKIRVKKYRQLLARNNLRSYKAISSFFTKFGADVEKDLTKVDIMTDINWEEFMGRLTRTFKTTFKTTIDSTAENGSLFMDVAPSKKDIAAIKNAALSKYNLTVKSKIKSVTDVTKSQISKVIEEGQRLGLNKRNIASNIANKFTEISQGRAKTIARTETSNATNITTNETAEYSGMEYKIWVHTGSGSHDRPSHLAMDGEKVKIDEEFSIGAMFPHDTTLPASEVVNCGCVCIYE